MARILIVDDEPMFRRTLRAILENAGHTVLEAEDGDQAIVRFNAEAPDLVITDIIMPDREGIETIGALRAKDHRLPIIAMSGGGSGDAEMFLGLARRLGASRTLKKPIRQADLLEAVEACLNDRT